MIVYLASPFFDDVELKTIKEAEETLLSREGIELFSPRLHENREERHKEGWSLSTFENDRRMIDACDAVVMLYYGNYSDSGTAWEAGYAFGSHKPVVVVHVDGGDGMSNLMIHESAHANISMDELASYDFGAMQPTSRWKGKTI